jgi:uncharacterized protein (DUF58 family)
MTLAPQNRLIWAVAAIAGTAALLAAVEPQFTPMAIGVVILLAITAAVDGIQSARSLRAIAVQTPQLIRTVRDRPVNLPFSIINSGSNVHRLHAAIELPESFTTPTPVIEGGPLLRTAQKFSLTAPFESNRRGEFHITRCDIASRSRLGLWTATKPAPINLTIRVYPNLRTDDAAAEFLKRTDAGSRLIRMTGKGREFEKLREYNHGDSYDEIDWKATARRGKPVVRVFQVERTQEIYVAIDASRLSARALDGHATLEHYVNAALIMGLAAEQQGDRFGLISFSDRLHKFVRARTGRQHFTVCREAIYRLQPRIVEPDFGELFSFLRTRLTKRALVVILTALDDPLIGETFARQVSLASRRHLTMAAMVRPEGARPLFEEDLTPDAETENTDPIYSQLAGHMAWRKLFELTKDLKRKGVRLHLLEPRKISGQLTALYLDVKRRQQL